MRKRYNNILETVGNTPVVKLNRMAPEGVNVYVKIESFNPMGSVKDRLALGVIEDAERSGALKPGQTVVEATSGNTGIGLAMVCAAKGYPLVVTMAENFSIERRKMLRFLGAKVVLTPASEKGSGMVNKAKELAEKFGWWQSRQFENPANAAVHERTTAVEIMEAFEDVGLDYWVTGFGTGGTLCGVSRALKAKSPFTKVIVCEPDNSQILASGICQARNPDGSQAASHPKFRPHLMQGWTPDFIPLLLEEVMQEARIDAFMPIDGNRAIQCSIDLARKEGIFVGITAGATLAGALELAETVPEGSQILCMLPDTGERYLSTPLFQDIPVEMSSEEMILSQATPGYRFDTTQGSAPDEAVEPPSTAVEDFKRLIAESEHPVVMFALEWCEFCWSVRKVLAAYGIAFTSVDLDSTAYQQDDRGGKLRLALRKKTGWNTFPQIFINGEFFGGCTDLFDGLKDRSLLEKLQQLGIAYDDSVDQDPYSFLPGWLHPR